MRNLMVLFLALSLTIPAFSQKPKIEWGDEFKLHKGSTDLDVVYSDQSGVYIQESHYALKSYFIIKASTTQFSLRLLPIIFTTYNSNTFPTFILKFI